MSKKTVTFKMPVKEPAQFAPPDDRAVSEEPTSPIATLANGAAERDEWVRSREADQTPPSLARSKGIAAIDLSAERDLHETVALALMVPPMLGWYWLLNSMNKYWGR